MKTKRSQLESFLKDHLETQQPSRVREAMEYSLMAGGKRVRPELLFLVMEAYGIPFEKGMEAAAALEMIHTYSLIHDDLPCMDNDDLRRGKPTSHKVFGESIALLAGDALLTQAFALLGQASLPAALKGELIAELSQAAGMNGMIYGQELDITLEDPDEHQIEVIQENKTARLIQAALKMGCLLAGRKEDLALWEQAGLLLGRQFQMVDDLLERVSDEATMGKSLSDAAHGKKTWISNYTNEQAREQIEAVERQIQDLIDSRDLDSRNLKEFVHALSRRSF